MSRVVNDSGKIEILMALAEIAATMAELRNGSQQITEAMSALQSSALNVRDRSQSMTHERELMSTEIGSVLQSEVGQFKVEEQADDGTISG